MRKAFDSVSQEAVIDALRAKGVSETLLNYVRESLMGSQTVLKVCTIATRTLEYRKTI